MPAFCIKRDKLPILFSTDYNVTFCGLQCLYPYDTEKGEHILHYLIMARVLTQNKLTKPIEISEDELLEVHSPDYLNSLKMSETVSKISELPLLSFIPNLLVQNCYLKAMRFQTVGSMKAAKLALREGWSINLGGGFSHCSSDEGGSFSPYLKKAFDEFWPNFIIYIAGTDILRGDTLGELCVSPEGIIARDELVFTKANSGQIPIVMLLGTGFTPESAKITADSIMNLKEKGLLPSEYWEG